MPSHVTWDIVGVTPLRSITILGLLEPLLLPGTTVLLVVVADILSKIINVTLIFFFFFEMCSPFRRPSKRLLRLLGGLGAAQHRRRPAQSRRNSRGCCWSLSAALCWRHWLWLLPAGALTTPIDAAASSIIITYCLSFNSIYVFRCTIIISTRNNLYFVTTFVQSRSIFLHK